MAIAISMAIILYACRFLRIRCERDNVRRITLRYGRENIAIKKHLEKIYG